MSTEDDLRYLSRGDGEMKEFEETVMSLDLCVAIFLRTGFRVLLQVNTNVYLANHDLGI